MSLRWAGSLWPTGNPQSLEAAPIATSGPIPPLCLLNLRINEIKSGRVDEEVSVIHALLDKRKVVGLLARISSAAAAAAAPSSVILSGGVCCDALCERSVEADKRPLPHLKVSTSIAIKCSLPKIERPPRRRRGICGCRCVVDVGMLSWGSGCCGCAVGAVVVTATILGGWWLRRCAAVLEVIMKPIPLPNERSPVRAFAPSAVV